MARCFMDDDCIQVESWGKDGHAVFGLDGNHPRLGIETISRFHFPDVSFQSHVDTTYCSWLDTTIRIICLHINMLTWETVLLCSTSGQFNNEIPAISGGYCWERLWNNSRPWLSSQLKTATSSPKTLWFHPHTFQHGWFFFVKIM